MLAYENIKDIYSLSPLQKGIYFHALYDNASLAYFEQMAYHFTGDLTIELIQRSLEELFERHDILRTVFNHEKIDVPLQIVLKKVDLDFHFEDLRPLGEDDKQLAHISSFKEKDKKRSFQLNKDVLVRVALFQTADEEFEFVWTHHHIIIDGWCSAILIAEFFEIYQSFLEKRPYQLTKVVPYRNYIHWLQKQDEAASHRYWKQYLENYSEPALLPKTKTKSKDGAYQRQVHTFQLSKEYSHALDKIAKEQQITLNAIFQAIWGVLLAKYNGRKDVVFGIIVSGRPSELEGVESMLGLFINTIPVRIQYDEHMRFDELLQAVHRQAIESQSHAYTSLADIQEASELKRNLIDHLYAFQNYQQLNTEEVARTDEQTGKKGTIRQVASAGSFEQTNYDFDVRVLPSNPLQVMFEYNGFVFDREAIDKLENDLVAIIGQLVENSRVLVENLQLSPLTEAQKAAIIAYNATEREYPSKSSLVDVFAEQVKARPAHPAVLFQDQSFTYQQLDQKSNQIAHFLLSHGLVEEGLVAVYQHQTFNLIASILGVLKAGGAYVTINIQYPVEPISNILNDLGMGIMLSESAFKEELVQLRKVCPQLHTFVCLDSDDAFLTETPENKHTTHLTASYIRSFSEEPVSVSVSPTQLANIIYTSGSTGKPKGILVEHRGINRLVINTNYITTTPEDVWAQTVNSAFDGSTFEIFAALLNGATLCLIPKEVLLDIRQLENALVQHRVTMMLLITPIFHEIAASEPLIFTGLHTLVVGGEAMNVKHFNHVQAMLPGLKIVNAYGPTENSVFSTSFTADHSVEEMPIGKPIANSEIYILDPQNNVLPFGMIGEIGVAGPGLARGYVNQVALTHEKFIPHPFKPHERLYKSGDNGRLLPNGNLMFLGRKDDQVKIRGYRIELGEVEKAVRGLPQVEEAVVLVVGADAEKQLCAFVKLHRPTDEAELRQSLATQLAAYLIPARFIKIEQFPLSPTAKVDRKALRELYSQQKDSTSANVIPPRNESEEAIAVIWREVLGTQNISVTDNFFEIGGHSLKAMQVVSRLSKTFEVQVDLKDFFTNPTIEEIALLIQEKEHSGYQEITPVPTEEHYKISHAQKRLWILNQYEENQTAYNISGAYQFQGLNREVFEQTLMATVDRHESLRTTFRIIEGEPRQIIHEAAALGVRVEYLNLMGDPQAEVKAHRLADEELYRPFDLEKGPLVRLKLLQLTEETFVFVFTMHHIISDGWSMRLLMEEVGVLYEAFSQGLPNPIPPLRVQYKDFVGWQHKRIQEKEEQYWLQKLSGELNWIQLPHDFPTTDYHAFRGAEEHLTLSKAAKEKLQELAHEHSTSLSNVLFTIFNILLYNISGQEDLVVGVAIANRNHPDVEKMVGFFVNTLVLRTQLSEESEFEEVLKQVSNNMVEAFDHQNYPFDLLVERLNPDRIANKQPIFNVLYGFQSFSDLAVGIAPTEEPSSVPIEKQAPLTIEAINQRTNTAKFDLTLFVLTSEGGLRLSFEYNSELFKPTAIQKWLQYFEKFVGVLVAEKATVE